MGLRQVINNWISYVRSISVVPITRRFSVNMGSTAALEVSTEETLKKQTLRPQHTISHIMDSKQITGILIEHGCVDLSGEFDLKCLEDTPPCSGGGWGDIICTQMRDGTSVAVKRTNVLTRSPDFKRMIKEAARELHIWSKCDHKNVMKLMGFVELNGRFSMVSPWMEGGDVSSYIQQTPEAGAEHRLDLCKQLANGLCYFHEQGMVHGDLKAQNALVSISKDREVVVKLTDFGSASIKHSSLSYSSLQATMRSLFWVPPELMRGTGTSPNFASDIYSLGMTVLEIITGEYPFSEWNQNALMCRLAYVGPQDAGAPLPTRPVCCIPPTNNGDQVWKLLTSCWSEISHLRPSALNVKESLESARLELSEIDWSHSGKPSHPVCKARSTNQASLATV
ncbi:unnamed protein product [Rhizoctonia solani]|uniref:Protein kinase domain-containing protein n=1 Tax=Rhizoctonia solani TaxID=456999 RepID=A0A8H3D7A4_9AGAM|nr:unnamed protein product [Rhizoctonia solani]